MKEIAIQWEGPFTLINLQNNKALVKSNGKEKDWSGNIGLYQIYGTHLLYGRNVLLYIGMTNNSFAARFSQHSDWINDEYDDVQVYLGRIGGTNKDISVDELKEQIAEAEKLLIYYCSPAYNSSNVYDIKTKKDGSKNPELRVFNFGKKSMLPTEISTEWYDNSFWKEDWILY